MLYRELAEVLRNRGFTVDIRAEAVHVEDDMCQDTTHYAQLWTEARYADVLEAKDELERPRGCGHQHDCCGCWFFTGFNVTSMYQTEGVAYIVVEGYSRNY